jgi:hypothetical protein
MSGVYCDYVHYGPPAGAHPATGLFSDAAATLRTDSGLPDHVACADLGLRSRVVAVSHVLVDLRRQAQSVDREPANPELMRRLEALRNKPMRIEGATDREPRLSHAMTWGVAGFALIALIQIVTQQPAHISAARWVACGCFALVIPWLAVLGFVVHDHMDPKRPPTIQQCLNMHAAKYAGNLIFCLGLASLLWSYDRSIAAIFVLTCYVAVRRFLSFAKRRAATATPAESAIIRLP